MTFDEMVGDFKSEKKLQLVEMAAKLWKEKEFADVKMTDIANACGIGIASLYRYFGTKSSLAVITAAYLWEKERKNYKILFSGDEYESLDGFSQISSIFGIFKKILIEDPGFFKFIHKFDQYILTENVPSKELELYEESVVNSYEIFQKAFQKGLEDGSICKSVDVKLYYKTATHTLTSLSQKLLAGSILESDSENNVIKEVEFLREILLAYLK